MGRSRRSPEGLPPAIAVRWSSCKATRSIEAASNGRLRPVDQQSQMEGRARQCIASKETTGLEKDSVANVSLLVAIDKRLLVDLVARISRRQLEGVLSGIDVILGK